MHTRKTVNSKISKLHLGRFSLARKCLRSTLGCFRVYILFPQSRQRRFYDWIYSIKTRSSNPKLSYFTLSPSLDFYKISAWRGRLKQEFIVSYLNWGAVFNAYKGTLCKFVLVPFCGDIITYPTLASKVYRTFGVTGKRILYYFRVT